MKETSLDNAVESATTTLYRAVIGPINLDYYLPILTRFEALDKAAPSWNWSACLYTLNWMIFRRLWGAALTYAAMVSCAPILLFGIGGLVLGFSEAQEIGFGAVFAALCFVIPGVFGNALLYVTSRKKMEYALTSSRTLNEACAMLSTQASSRQRLIWLLLANLILVCAVAAIYLTFQYTSPARQGTQSSEKSPATAIDLVKKPMLLIMPIRTSSSAPLPIPPVPAASTRVLARAASMPAVPDSTVELIFEWAIDSNRAASMPAVPDSTPATTEATAPRQQALAATPGLPTPAAATPRYYINVGLFANQSNARHAHAKLIDAGLTSFRQAVQSGEGKLTRLRVGPFDSQEQADAAVEKIHALHLDAVVIRR